MIRKPSSPSSGVSRPESPVSAASAGSRAGSSLGGSRAGSSLGGSRAGTSAGTRVGAAVTGGNGGQSIDAPFATASPGRRPASPALIGLACAGWATFLLLWVFVITIMINRGDAVNTALAQAEQAPTLPSTPPPTTQAAPTTPPPTAPRANTPAQVDPDPPSPTPSNPAPTPTPTNTNTPSPTPANPQPTPAEPTPAPPALSDNNPFGMTQANVLGLELNPGHTAVLFDAIEKSSGWLGDGKAALMVGLTRAAPQRRVSLLTTSDGELRSMDANPFAPGAGRFTPLNAFLSPVEAVGRGGLSAGLDAAIGTGADEVVFITSRATGWAGYLNTLRGKLGTDSGNPIKLHIIQIGDANADLQAFVEGPDNDGTYLLLTEDQLRTWRRESR